MFKKNPKPLSMFIYFSVLGGKNKQNFYSMPKVKRGMSISSTSSHTSLGTDIFISSSQKRHHKKLYFWEWQPWSLSSQYTHSSNLQVF